MEYLRSCHVDPRVPLCSRNPVQHIQTLHKAQDKHETNLPLHANRNELHHLRLLQLGLHRSILRHPVNLVIPRQEVRLERHRTNPLRSDKIHSRLDALSNARRLAKLEGKTEILHNLRWALDFGERSLRIGKLRRMDQTLHRLQRPEPSASEHMDFHGHPNCWVGRHHIRRESRTNSKFQYYRLPHPSSDSKQENALRENPSFMVRLVRCDLPL